MTGVSRKATSKALKKWVPMWGTFGSYLSTLPMNHGYYEQELPEEHKENNLLSITHLVDGKDMLIETIRNNDSLKRRIRSEKYMNLPREHLISQPLWDFLSSTLEL